MIWKSGCCARFSLEVILIQRSDVREKPERTLMSEDLPFSSSSVSTNTFPTQSYSHWGNSTLYTSEFKRLKNARLSIRSGSSLLSNTLPLIFTVGCCVWECWGGSLRTENPGWVGPQLRSISQETNRNNSVMILASTLAREDRTHCGGNMSGNITWLS